MLQSKQMTVSLSLAVALVASTALPAVCGTKIDAAAEMSSEYTAVYYFTDRSDCDDYVSRVVAPAAYAEGFTSDQIFVYDWWSDGNTCVEDFQNYYASGKVYDVSNALVIFDIQRLKENATDIASPIPDAFKTFFSIFKENGCEIMLVLDVDEMRLLTCNDFFDYVDFHVNTDVAYPFIGNMVNKIEDYLTENGSDEFDNYSVCINTLEPGGQWTFDDLIVPYLRSKGSLSSMDIEKMLQECAEKYNVYWTTEISVPTEYVFALSFNDPDNRYREWADSLISANGDVQIAFGEMVENLFLEQETKRYGMPHVLWDTVDAAVADFIAGNDVTGYNNYDGRCEISYKALPFGEDGWMEYPFEGGDGIEEWQIYSVKFIEE